MRPLSPDEQNAAVLALQEQLWKIVADRFEQLKAEEGFKQADLARALGISAPQIHVWLTEPDKMTLKAAGRLLLAMRAGAACAFVPAPRPGDRLATVVGSAGGALSRWTASLVAWVALMVGSVTIFPLDAAARTRALSLEPLATHSEIPSGPSIVMFWRADCGPCLIELRRIDQLERAARPLPIVTVALDEPAVAAEKLKEWGISPRFSWRLKADPARTLQALGGGPPRLPLAVAFHGDGLVCRRRIGLLGTDTVKAWVKTCSR